MEMRGPISQVSAIMAKEIKLSSTPDTFIKKTHQVLGKVPRADMLAAQNQVQCDMTEYSTRVFWLFSFVSTLHSLMCSSSTSLHDAVMEHLTIDSVSGKVAMMCHSAQDSIKKIDYSKNPTLEFIHDSVSMRDRVHLGGGGPIEDFDTSMYVCDIDATIVDTIQELMGVPNSYMKKMVDCLEALLQDGEFHPSTNSHLEIIHTQITGLAVGMCEVTMDLFSKLRSHMIASSHTHILSSPYQNAFVILGDASI
jgi:hypothetical protein